ncbi:hypothetical protein L6452_11734 [Arctium lappa]|uniref:Uncharacterized protein n=1 Tax=Arctium lappa TaxID=4217 RepID=A0ACB9DQ31_ARCLA|nr:hypothetical protein L6452_11734 [Arctium lappa]
MASQNRNYRVWTNHEEAKLVEALVAMVNTGSFKADNGFKSGYLTYLENALKDSLPTSNILGRPHIESKLKIMKKDWMIVHDMLSGSYTSGFGYDSVQHCVVADDQVWESYLQVHKGAGKWRNKTFPFYEDLCIVFGKDRAQGNRARDFVEVEEEVNIEDQEQHMHEELDDVMATSHIQGGNANMPSEETSSGRGRKRKRRVDPMADVFNSAVTKLGESLEKMANKLNKGIDREEELDKKRSLITSEVSKMQSFTQSQKFTVISKIREDPERVNMFWDLPEADREAFVKWILDE